GWPREARRRRRTTRARRRPPAGPDRDLREAMARRPPRRGARAGRRPLLDRRRSRTSCDYSRSRGALGIGILSTGPCSGDREHALDRGWPENGARGSVVAGTASTRWDCGWPENGARGSVVAGTASTRWTVGGLRTARVAPLWRGPRGRMGPGAA